MPLVKVIRKGITPFVRKVPTSTCMVMTPMTLDRVDKEVESEKEDPTEVKSLAEAFEKFEPKFSFVGSAGEGEFNANFEFHSIKDFDPASFQKRQEIRNNKGEVIRNEKGEVKYLQNDLVDLKAKIDLLYRLKDRWKLPAVRRAWSDPAKRSEIIQALERLRSGLEGVSKKG